MKTSLQLLSEALTAMGADGLCNPDEDCGCDIEELAPCENLNLSECKAAKWYKPARDSPEFDEDYSEGYYKVME